MAASQRQRSEEYMQKHRIHGLFEMLIAQLLIEKPDNPKAFLVDYLEKSKSEGMLPVVTDQDLDTMFNMFDLTKNGKVSVQQANAALKTLLGPDANIQSAGAGFNMDKPMTRVQFISGMSKVLKKAVPDAQLHT